MALTNKTLLKTIELSEVCQAGCVKQKAQTGKAVISAFAMSGLPTFICMTCLNFVLDVSKKKNILCIIQQ